MQGKRVANGLLGGTTVIALVAIVVRTILKLFGYADLVAGFDQTWALLTSPAINWSGVWVWTLFLSGGVLVALNFDWVQLRYRNWRRRNDRDWSTTLLGAIEYIAKYSMISGQDEGRYDAAAEAFSDAARRRLIVVAGIPANGANLEIVPKSAWRRGVIVGDTLINPTPPNDLLYRNLVVDGGELREVWPARPTSHSWMARI